MQLLIHEIKQAKKKADAANMKFAVRLNCTSDISPEEFTLKGVNILQFCESIQFYDYTKVFEHTKLSENIATMMSPIHTVVKIGRFVKNC